MLDHPTRFLLQRYGRSFLLLPYYQFSLIFIRFDLLVQFSLVQVCQTQVFQVLGPIAGLLMLRQVSIHDRMDPVILFLLIVGAVKDLFRQLLDILHRGRLDERLEIVWQV